MENQIQIVIREDIEKAMRGLENSVLQGDFIGASSYFISLLSSGGQFSLDVEEFDPDKAFDNEEKKQPIILHSSHQMLYDNLKQQNYAKQIQELQEQKKKMKQISQQMNSTSLNNISSDQSLNNNNNSNNMNNNSFNNINNNSNNNSSSQPYLQSPQNSQRNSSTQQFSAQNNIIDVRSTFTNEELMIVYRNLNINPNYINDESFKKQKIDELFLNYLSQQYNIL